MRRAQASTALLLLLACGLASGCGDTASGKAEAHVVVNERDFHIAAPAVVDPGRVDLKVNNLGPDDHELILVRGRGSSLPVRSDGLTVDEEALAHREAGSLEPGQPGASRNLDVNLKPGHYVMFCNMYGHFKAGMHRNLVVR